MAPLETPFLVICIISFLVGVCCAINFAYLATKVSKYDLQFKDKVRGYGISFIGILYSFVFFGISLLAGFFWIVAGLSRIASNIVAM